MGIGIRPEEETKKAVRFTNMENNELSATNITDTTSTSNVLESTFTSFNISNLNSHTIKTRYDIENKFIGSKQIPSKQLTPLEKFKKVIFKLFEPKDDSYSTGEYNKNSDVDNKEYESDTNARESWSGELEFFLSCLGCAVGVGAIWRFPYLCYKNGGGVFLIPYLLFLFLLGIPLFFLELNLGQFTNKGPTSCWQMAPWFTGLGIASMISSFYLCTYYNMLIAYSTYYLFLSFRTVLPWQYCDPAWASLNCTDSYNDTYVMKCDQPNQYRDLLNGMCYSYGDGINRQPLGWWDIKKRLEYRKPVLPSQDYFNNVVLRKTPGLENSQDLVPELVLFLLLTWIIIYLCCIKGVKSSGKVVYVTAIFPFVVLIILGICGWTLEGSSKGIAFYIKPDFSRLLTIGVWFDAATQTFFTLGTAYGTLMALSSYNKFETDTYRTTFMVCTANALTEIFAGFVVFAYIGNLSHITQQPVADVVSSGPGLAFIVFPFAVTQLPFPPIWAVLFFIMMLTLGLDSEFAMLESIITSVCDSFPAIKKKRSYLLLNLCIAMFLLGLPFCTRGGQYWIEIMDKFSGGWAILIIGLLEVICIGWVYGSEKFYTDIRFMIGDHCNNPVMFWYFRIMWQFVIPPVVTLLIIVSWVQFTPLKTDQYVFPIWANVIGWVITASVLMGIILWWIYCIIDVFLINKRPFKTLFKPTEEWGPLKTSDKIRAVHLPNLEKYHESKTRKRNIVTVS